MPTATVLPLSSVATVAGLVLLPPPHQAERKRWEPVVESGYASCVRCGLPVVAGAAFHLDHRDDKLGYLGVSHARCNVRAAAMLGNKLMREKQALERALNPPRRVASREW